VEVAAPGMDKQDFNVQLNSDDQLVIRMEKKAKDEKARAKETRAIEIH
jgi:HSP20 family protein